MKVFFPVYKVLLILGIEKHCVFYDISYNNHTGIFRSAKTCENWNNGQGKSHLLPIFSGVERTRRIWCFPLDYSLSPFPAIRTDPHSFVFLKVCVCLCVCACVFCITTQLYRPLVFHFFAFWFSYTFEKDVVYKNEYTYEMFDFLQL